MSGFMEWLLPIIGDSWLIQGLIANTVFSLCSIPFTKVTIRNVFKNRKKERIKAAQNEFEILCAQKMIIERHIEKNYFENQLFLLATKYNLETKDIYNDEKAFGKKLINKIIGINLIDGNTKEAIASQIRNNNIFVNLEYNNKIIENENILSEENDIPPSKDNIELNQNEKQKISKLTLIVTIGIFISLLFVISIVQILYKVYGINAIIFIDTVFMMIIMTPILINGIFHYEKFNETNKKWFCLFLMLILLNIINCICIVNILLNH